jgi:hypothetical protein
MELPLGNSIRRCASAFAVLGLMLAQPALNGAGSTTIGLTGRSNAQVSMAADGQFVALVWASAAKGGPPDVYSAVSRDGGATFSAPSRVNTEAGKVDVNGEQPPRVTLVPRPGGTPEIVVIWRAKQTAGTALITARSTDGGRTFSRSAPVSGTDVAGNRGWEAIGTDGRSRVLAVWLDHRRLAEKESAVSAAHVHGATGSSKPDGVAMAQLSQLYFGALDGSTPPRPVAGGVCYCCKTAIASSNTGGIFLAWRHVYPGNLRDIAFTMSSDAGRTFSNPVRVSEDQWAIAGCPEDGPTIALDIANRVHVVWPTVVSENGTESKALFHAMSSDGRTFSPRQRIPTSGTPNHPQLSIGRDGTFGVVWDEAGGGLRRIASARGVADKNGRVQFERQPSSGTEDGTYPVIASTGSGLILAWTAGPPDASMIHLQRF